MKQGTWRDWYTGQQLDNYSHPWLSPSDVADTRMLGVLDEREKDAYHCLGMSTWWPDHDWNIQFNMSWFEGKCKGSWRGCPCWNPYNRPILKLRGLCPKSHLQTRNPDIGLRFTPVQQPTTFAWANFTGGMSTDIFWDWYHDEGVNPRWKIRDSVMKVTASTTASHNSYALGLNDWSVVGDSINCYEGENYTIKLKLSGCENDEFTCNAGQCVMMKQR